MIKNYILDYLKLIFLVIFLVCEFSTFALTEENKKIQIAEYGEYPLYTSLYVAYSKGYFLEQRLDVEIIPAGGDEKVFAALLSGDAQFGVGDPIFTAISGERGMPGKVIAASLVGIPIELASGTILIIV